MTGNDELALFIQRLRKQFPALTSRADELAARRSIALDGNEPHLWMEQFANATNELMENRGEAQLKSTFGSVSASFNTGSDAIKRMIDVAFVENLFWRVSKPGSKLGWTLLPSNLRSLYVEFHGKPPI